MIKTVSLETAKLLKEAGYPQGDREPQYYKQPTTDELLEELPFRIRITKIPDRSYIVSFPQEFETKEEGKQIGWKTFQYVSLPEALAQMWLWLKKEKLI